MSNIEHKKEKWKKKIMQYIMIALGVILLDVAFYFFMDPAKLVLGGMMGLSILLEPYYSRVGTWFTPSIFLLITNTLALIIGGLLLGKDFFFKTIFSSFFSPLVVFVFEQLFDPMLFLSNVSEGGFYIIALICGSILSGIGLGIALKNNGSTGGMDVVQKVMSKYLHVPYSKTMYLTDWVIVILSGFTFGAVFSFHLEQVVYGILGVLAVAVIIDTIVLNARRRRTAYIITLKPYEVRDAIYERLGRGVTFVDVQGAYTQEKKCMLICTMEKNEAYKLTEFLNEVDPQAFSFVTSTREIVGEYDSKLRGFL